MLRLTLDPDSISLGINLNGAGEWFDLEREDLTACLTSQQLPPYSVLLLEVLGGDQTLSIRGDEAEQCWRIIDPVLAAWADDAVPLEEYPAGSSGPEPHTAARGSTTGTAGPFIEKTGQGQ
ncbi:MAG: hypothetical protein ACT4NP_16995 [Pseudonocardiales bacterium]